MRLVPADSLDLDALTDLFNEAYSDYVVPIRFDRAGIEFTLDVTDVDLRASRVGLVGGEPVTFAILALRGDEGWIAGMGTVPAHRRKGLGESALSAVLVEARDRGAEAVRLEVIDANSAARQLYEKLGFRRVRDLVVWVLEIPASRPTGARPAGRAEAQAWIVANRPQPEPWQRADATLRRMDGRGLETQGFVVERGGETVGAVLHQHGTGLPRILQIAARDEGAAAELLAAVAACGAGLRFINVPSDEPSSDALERLGARAEVRQHEMRLRL